MAGVYYPVKGYLRRAYPARRHGRSFIRMVCGPDTLFCLFNKI